MEKRMVGVSTVDKIMLVIKEHFEVVPDIYEVAMYVMSTIAIQDAVLQGMESNSTEVRGIPPEAYDLARRFNSGLTINKFWLENYAPIKMQLVMDHIKSNSMSKYINFGESEPEKTGKEAFTQAKSILLSRFDVLTTIAFLWKGVRYAEDFDLKLRLVAQLSPEHERYFNSKGV